MFNTEWTCWTDGEKKSKVADNPRKHFLFFGCSSGNQQNGGKGKVVQFVGGGDGGEGGGRFDTCCSILERGARAKLAAQMANVYNGIERCPA